MTKVIDVIGRTRCCTRKIKYGELTGKQEELLIKQFINDDLELEDVFDLRPSEYFYAVADHILTDWQTELGHGGKRHTAKIDNDNFASGVMEHRKYNEMECNNKDFDVCDMEKTARYTNGICKNCGRTKAERIRIQV